MSIGLVITIVVIGVVVAAARLMLENGFEHVFGDEQYENPQLGAGQYKAVAAPSKDNEKSHTM